ncbi:S1 family peptidase [Nonomuraea sp. NPDC001831]|uniref:S1 family peptidase n=1 Tax=Nonomuraea sp. NPDC001831 TaxID=3364340 RepID=UPI00368D8DAF
MQNIRLRRTVLILACAVVPFLGAGAASAVAASGPDLTRQSADTGGKPPARDSTGPRGQVPGGFASWDALFAEQTRLNAVADRVTAVAETSDGYGGVVVAPENHEVRLYWKGQVPAPVRAVVDEGRLTAPVSVLPSAFSYADLLAEADKWSESGQVTGAAPQADGSGVRLSVPDEDTAPDQLQRPGGATAPITLERGERFDPAYSRQDDVPSYYAGGRTWNARTGSGCSSGFAVYDKNGNPGFLTAAHCGEFWDSFYDGGGSGSPANRMGDLQWRLPKRDAAIVLADATADVFDGGPAASTSNRVVALWKAYVGNFVCNSGASLGEYCLIKVTETGWSGTYTNGQYVKHMVRAKSVVGGCAVAHGDSGGPVYSYTNWFDDVAAQGITSAISKPVPCGGLDGGRVIVFSRVWDVALAFGASVQVH